MKFVQLENSRHFFCNMVIFKSETGIAQKEIDVVWGLLS